MSGSLRPNAPRCSRGRRYPRLFLPHLFSAARWGPGSRCWVSPGPRAPSALPARWTGVSPASLRRCRQRQRAGCRAEPPAPRFLGRRHPPQARPPFSLLLCRRGSVGLGMPRRRAPSTPAAPEPGGLEMGGELPLHPCAPQAAKNPLWRDPTTAPRGRGLVTPLDVRKLRQR